MYIINLKYYVINENSLKDKFCFRPQFQDLNQSPWKGKVVELLLQISALYLHLP